MEHTPKQSCEPQTKEYRYDGIGIDMRTYSV